MDTERDRSDNQILNMVALAAEVRDRPATVTVVVVVVTPVVVVVLGIVQLQEMVEAAVPTTQGRTN